MSTKLWFQRVFSRRTSLTAAATALTFVSLSYGTSLHAQCTGGGAGGGGASAATGGTGGSGATGSSASSAALNAGASLAAMQSYASMQQSQQMQRMLFEQELREYQRYEAQLEKERVARIERLREGRKKNLERVLEARQGRKKGTASPRTSSTVKRPSSNFDFGDKAVASAAKP